MTTTTIPSIVDIDKRLSAAAERLPNGIEDVFNAIGVPEEDVIGLRESRGSDSATGYVFGVYAGLVASGNDPFADLFSEAPEAVS